MIRGLRLKFQLRVNPGLAVFRKNWRPDDQGIETSTYYSSYNASCNSCKNWRPDDQGIETPGE